MPSSPTTVQRGIARHAPEGAARLAEVWGDTVDLRHLGLAMSASCAISLACFLLAQRMFPPASYGPEIARTYSLLGGLLGCLIGGTLSAILFRPKRTVIERADDASWEAQVIDGLVTETGSLGSVAELPDATVREMKELGLYELFHRHDGAVAGDAASRAATGADAGA